MPLCFIEPQDAIRVIAGSVGREARRQLVGEVVRAWVDGIPEQELSLHYAKAIADLDEQDLNLLAAWHASLEVGHPIANTDFLVGVFPSLGENRREALKIAAGFRGEEAFQAGVSEDEALDTVLPRLSMSVRWSWPTSASSCTSGTASAATTSAGTRIVSMAEESPPPRTGRPGAPDRADHCGGRRAGHGVERRRALHGAEQRRAARAYRCPRHRSAARGARRRRAARCARHRCAACGAPAGDTAAANAAATGGAVPSEEDVLDALANVIDPELGLDFVELGLIYGVELTGGDVRVTFTLTTPACPIGPAA